MMGLTGRQAQLFSYINRFVVEHNGLAPSFDQMAQALGLKSKSGIHRILNGLEERGMVRRIAGKYRALEITAKDSGAFFESLNPTARYVIKSIAQRECVEPELVMREYLNEWADALRRDPSDYLDKTRVAA